MDYPGIEGFLGNRASLMLDVVFLAMFIVVPVMAWSIYLVKKRQRYLLHKRIQLTLGIVLLVAVLLFEVDIRLNGWQERAEASPFYAPEWYRGLVNWSLWVHLFFAITTCVIWIAVIVQAMRKFPRVPTPNAHSRSHKKWATVAAIDMFLTAVTGWIFYLLAFVAG